MNKKDKWPATLTNEYNSKKRPVNKVAIRKPEHKIIQ